MGRGGEGRGREGKGSRRKARERVDVVRYREGRDEACRSGMAARAQSRTRRTKPWGGMHAYLIRDCVAPAYHQEGPHVDCHLSGSGETVKRAMRTVQYTALCCQGPGGSAGLSPQNNIVSQLLASIQKLPFCDLPPPHTPHPPTHTHTHTHSLTHTVAHLPSRDMSFFLSLSLSLSLSITHTHTHTHTHKQKCSWAALTAIRHDVTMNATEVSVYG